MVTKKCFLGISIAIILSCIQAGMAEEKKNYISVYGGRTTERDLQTLGTLRNEGFIHSNIGVVALARELLPDSTSVV
jgi:hypothetical protein